MSVRALLGGIRRALEIYRQVDAVTHNYLWSQPTTEEVWHCHAQSVLMVTLRNVSLPLEDWRSAELLRATPTCRLVLMMCYHLLGPALSSEEASLMSYLQSPPYAGPAVSQATAGLQNWRRTGRRLVQSGGRLPSAIRSTSLLLRF